MQRRHEVIVLGQKPRSGHVHMWMTEHAWTAEFSYRWPGCGVLQLALYGQVPLEIHQRYGDVITWRVGEPSTTAHMKTRSGLDSTISFEVERKEAHCPLQKASTPADCMTANGTTTQHIKTTILPMENSILTVHPPPSPPLIYASSPSPPSLKSGTSS